MSDLHRDSNGNLWFKGTLCAYNDIEEGLCLTRKEYYALNKSFLSDYRNAPWPEDMVKGVCYVSFDHECKFVKGKDNV